MTLGIELLLAADIRVAAAGTRFSQLEVRRGIYPFGGATLRFPHETGWGNVMRWMLTGDEFDATEALRIGLVQEIADTPVDRTRQIAHTIAGKAAPLGVGAVLTSAHRARRFGDDAAISMLGPDVARLFKSADGAEGIQSLIERRNGEFAGR